MKADERTPGEVAERIRKLGTSRCGKTGTRR